jgi:hypothetical protein
MTTIGGSAIQLHNFLKVLDTHDTQTPITTIETFLIVAPILVEGAFIWRIFSDAKAKSIK